MSHRDAQPRNYFDTLPQELQEPILHMGHQRAVNDDLHRLRIGRGIENTAHMRSRRNCRVNGPQMLRQYQTTPNLELIEKVFRQNGVNFKNPETWGKECWAVYHTMCHLDSWRRSYIWIPNKIVMCHRNEPTVQHVLQVLQNAHSTADQIFAALNSLDKSTLQCIGY